RRGTRPSALRSRASQAIRTTVWPRRHRAIQTVVLAEGCRWSSDKNRSNANPNNKVLKIREAHGHAPRVAEKTASEKRQLYKALPGSKTGSHPNFCIASAVPV